MSKCPRLFLSTFKTHRSYIITYYNIYIYILYIYIYRHYPKIAIGCLDAIGVNSIVGTHSLFWLCAN